VHVRDVVEALTLVGRAGMVGGTWNVAVGRSVSVATLAELVERAFGQPLGRSFDSRRAGDVTASVISPAALRRLGWRPTVGLDAGLAELLRGAHAAPRPYPEPA
jgi:nucleoside-diphosphate-sugar epimerase